MGNQHLIANRYQIGELLSEGGIGLVYLGTDIRSNQPVAVKVLRSQMISGRTEMVERFALEAEALRALNHPNIVKVLATATEDSKQYIIMEYVSGGSLRDLLDRQEQLSISRTVEIALDLADALTRAHRLDIIHRDLKPANVLLAGDGSPRLSDFGIAKVGSKYSEIAPGLTQAGTILGTIEYLSPEACCGEALDARTDIWALGVMLFEMLAGRRPFPHQAVNPTITAILTAILTQPIPDLGALRPDAPDHLVDLIYRMLTRAREARISSMRLVGAELEIIMQGVDSSTSGTMKGLKAAQRFATITPQPIDVPRLNLPRQTTPFIGRENELAELANLLADPDLHLITLLGPGGAGKTRLAIESAQSQLCDFKDGVTFVPLAPLNSAESISTIIAETVGFQFFEHMDPGEQLAGYFRDKQMLLLLDNFEHILDGAKLLSVILSAAPGVKVLATSREKLNLQEEIRFRIDGMDFPEDIQPITIEEAAQYSAIRLFTQAAKQARPNFELQDKDLSYVTRICHLVRGMPLGILLAASWIEMFSPQEIAAEVSRSLDFLETEVSDIPERHRSIRAVFDSTWSQITPEERETFMKLAIFRGGFMREAATAVAGASLHRLVSLVSKSLLHRDPETGRYEVHELLRQYAEERLAASGKIEAARDTHCHYYAAFMAHRLKQMLGPDQIKALNEIEVEFGNVRQAWLWAVERKDFDALEQALESLFVFSDMRSREHEGVALIGLAREKLAPQLGEEPHPTWGLLLLPWYDLLLQTKGRPQDNQEIMEQAEICLSLAQKRGDQLGMAYALILLAHFSEAAESLKMYERALELKPRMDDSFWVRIRMGLCYRNLGVHQEAINAFRQSYERGREIGESEKMGYGLFNLGESEMFLGDNINAIFHFEGAIAHLRQVGTLWGIILSNVNLSLLLFLKGDLDQARTLIEEAQALANESNRFSIIKRGALTVLGFLALIEQAYQSAALCFEEILEAYDSAPEASLGLTFVACENGDVDTAKQHLQDALQPPIPYRAPAMEILCLPAAAFITRFARQKERAVELLALATNQPQGFKDLIVKWPLLMHLRAGLEAELTPQEFEAAWARGQAGDLADTLKILGDQYGSERPQVQPLKKGSHLSLPTREQVIREPLSERELDVLQLLKTELSGPEIAQELMVSLNTIRFHTKNIYTKLEVNNRRSAVNRAIELGL